MTIIDILVTIFAIRLAKKIWINFKTRSWTAEDFAKQELVTYQKQTKQRLTNFQMITRIAISYAILSQLSWIPNK